MDDKEPEGISVYLESCTTPAALATAIAGRRYYVARLTVADFTRLGLNVVPNEDGDRLGLRGHCVVPELNSDYSIYSKDRSKEIEDQLAIVASENIVYCPPQ